MAHDWGGGIGMGAAVAAPERFSRFVLMNTAAFRAERCPWPIHLCQLPLLGQVAVQGLNLFVRAALRTTVAKPERMTPAVRAGYLAPYDSWAHRVAVYRFVLDIPIRRSHPSYQTLVGIEQGLAKFRQHPVCLIWGMRRLVFLALVSGAVSGLLSAGRSASSGRCGALRGGRRARANRAAGGIFPEATLVPSAKSSNLLRIRKSANP